MYTFPFHTPNRFFLNVSFIVIIFFVFPAIFSLLHLIVPFFLPHTLFLSQYIFINFIWSVRCFYSPLCFNKIYHTHLYIKIICNHLFWYFKHFAWFFLIFTNLLWLAAPKSNSKNSYTTCTFTNEKKVERIHRIRK